MIQDTTTNAAITYTWQQDGGPLQCWSTTPWFRFFRAAADLCITEQLDFDAFSDVVEPFLHLGVTGAISDPAACALLRGITLAIDEPSCLCDPYREAPCTCEPMDRRERLRQLIGG